MRKIEKIFIILGTAHLATTPGKRSPDGKFRECVYSREIAKLVYNKLSRIGYRVAVDYPGLNPNAQMKGATWKQEQTRELTWRSNLVNQMCKTYGTGNCLYVSIHVNAAGNGSAWMNARGWAVYTSPGKTKSDTLATCLFNEAKERLPHDSKYYVRADWSDGDPDYEAKFHVLTKTKCPAVLTENLFQDNKEDVEFLLSDAGKKTIVDIHVNGILNFLNADL